MTRGKELGRFGFSVYRGKRPKQEPGIDEYYGDEEMRPDNGFCPHCGVSLDGLDILEHFKERIKFEPLPMGKTPEEIADMYGYSEGRTKWDRRIGRYSTELDRIVQWSCPDCKGEWK